MGTMFGLAALTVAVLVGIPTALNMIGSRKPLVTLGSGVATWVIFTLITTGIWYFQLPVAGLSATAFYANWLIWFGIVIVSGLITGAATVFANDEEPTIGSFITAAVVVVALLWSLGAMNVWSDDEAKVLAHSVTVKMPGESGAYPDSDANHIVVVPEEVALNSARAAMNSSGANLSTVFEADNPTLQAVDGHFYYIVALKPRGAREIDSVQGITPGYMVVDAEDNSKPATYRSKGADGTEFKIRYSFKFGQGEYLLERHVWRNGYADTPIDDWTLEVDDQWRPFWTASTNKVALRFNETIPDGLITVDAQTGQIERYAIGKIPAWIDRIYSASTVKTMLGWWGDYGMTPYPSGGFGRNTVNRYMVHGDPTLVYTKEGYPCWQVQLTSLNNDVSVAYLALFNGRDDTVRLYTIPDLQLEEGIVGAVKGVGKDNTNQLAPQHLAIHSIYGHLTWVGSLVNNGVVQGISLIPADQKPNGSNIIVRKTMGEALSAYQVMLATGASAKPGEQSTSKVITAATVTSVSSPIVDSAGATSIYFYVKGDASIYRVAIDPTASGSKLEAAFMKTGSVVTFSYNEIPGQTLRTVQEYDDLGLPAK